MSEAWQNIDGQQVNRGSNPTFGSRNFNNSNFNRGQNSNMNGGGYQGNEYFY